MLPDIEALQHFHFLRPAFALFLIPWLVLLLLQKRKSASNDMFGGIIAPHLLEHLRLKRVATSWFNPRSVSSAFILLILVVLLGPSWRQQSSPLHKDEAALVIMLDVSTSMLQQDIQPSRLQRAKQKVADLLDQRPGKKAALIVYSGSAHTVLSLTADREILNQYLAAVAPTIMPRPGKFPEYALAHADKILRQTRAPATLLIFTDALGADSRMHFERYFEDHPHQLVVVGTGTVAAETPLTPLEEESLRGLTSDTDGRYIRLTSDDSDMRKVNRYIDSHYVVVDDNALPWLDSGYILVFPALALFILWFRVGWTLTWSALVIPIFLSLTPQPTVAQELGNNAQDTDHKNAQDGAGENYLQRAQSWFVDLWLTGDQQGRLLMQLGHYTQAAAQFTDPMWKGAAHYYAEDFMLAAQYFSRSDSPKALFNEANARAHARDYVRALHRYNMLLQQEPNWPGAVNNRDRVQQLIEDINRLSQSQQQEAGVSGEDKDLSGDDAIPAQGADELDWQKTEIAQLSAQDILADPAVAEMWLRGVQQNPSAFLTIKFGMQLQDANRKTIRDTKKDTRASQ